MHKASHTFKFDYAGLRFRTNQSPPVSLLSAGSARDQEEEDENYEMESMASHSRESRFGKGWRWTTTV